MFLAYINYFYILFQVDLKCDGAVTELRLVRTILERLELSFASQEAKIDRLLRMMSSKPPQQLYQQPFSTPDMHRTSIEYPFSPPSRTTSYPETEMAVSRPLANALPDPDRVFERLEEMIRPLELEQPGT